MMSLCVYLGLRSLCVYLGLRSLTVGIPLSASRYAYIQFAFEPLSNFFFLLNEVTIPLIPYVVIERSDEYQLLQATIKT